MANHELPCTNCPVPCESPDYNPYNEDCEVWTRPVVHIAHRNSLPKMDWKAYEKAFYKSHGDIPPSERPPENQG